MRTLDDLVGEGVAGRRVLVRADLNVPLADDRNEAGLPQLPTHDVKIVNSTFTNGNGIVVGSEAVNGVYNVVARNIVEFANNDGTYDDLAKYLRRRKIR